MGLLVTTDIRCDGTKEDGSPCGAEVAGEIDRQRNPSAARRAAKANGWIRTLDPSSGRMVDLCPSCVEKELS